VGEEQGGIAQGDFANASLVAAATALPPFHSPSPSASCDMMKSAHMPFQAYRFSRGLLMDRAASLVVFSRLTRRSGIGTNIRVSTPRETLSPSAKNLRTAVSSTA
jgi:hypothetical protein